MLVHVLLYESGKDNEGIHSLEFNGETLVLMFQNKDDADRYCGLLEAQDFPTPTVEVIEKNEIEEFCKVSGYQARFIEEGFVPKTKEDRLLLSPPEASKDISQWGKIENEEEIDIQNKNEIDDIRKKLEGLL